MVTMLLIDVLIRYPAVALLLLFATLALRQPVLTRAAVLALLTTVSVAALLLGTAPEALRLPFPAQAVTRILDAPCIVLIWWLGRAMFEDDFRLGRLEWGVFGAFVAPLMVLRLQELGAPIEAPPWLPVWLDLVSYGVMAHLAWSTLRGRSDDMIEARRNWRYGFVLALALAIGVSVSTETLFSTFRDDLVSLGRAVFALVLTVWIFLSLASLHIDALTFQAAPPRPATDIDPRDKALHARLLAAMEQDQAYATPGLSVADLAERLGAPEHRLRALINQGLGHRNFVAFLNVYRLAAAKQALRDPAQARKQILAIAMATGFGSLAPFNRAFKASEGITPTEYRRAALSGDQI